MTPADGQTMAPASLEPGEHHFQIAQKAEVFLKNAANGNGLDAAQVRLVRHDTAVWPLHGAVTAVLKPHIAKTQRKGNVPQGEQAASPQLALARLDAMAADVAASPEAHAHLAAALAKDSGGGWEIEAQNIPLNVTPRPVFTLDRCQKCAGQGGYNCVPCHASGRAPCAQCTGLGTQPCQPCHGTGHFTRPDGSRTPCNRCHSTGKAPCILCNGQKTQHCKPCNGTGRAPCHDCASSGWWTTVYTPNWAVQVSFALNRQDANPGALALADRIGMRALAAEGHAEILRDPPVIGPGAVTVPLIALFPIAGAEFAAGGKSLPAEVAGLKGRVMRIDPFLDPFLKPALDALVKVSQGGIATSALLATACKSRLVYDVLGAVPKMGKKKTYLQVLAEYGPSVSDKYARSAVARGAEALSSLGKGPRMQGLAGGTVIAAAIAAAWFLTPARGHAIDLMTARNLARFSPAADIAVWLAGWGAAVALIKVLATRAVARLLPAGEKPTLQTMDREGWYALGTTGLFWLGLAVAAAPRPEWLAAVLKKFGI